MLAEAVEIASQGRSQRNSAHLQRLPARCSGKRSGYVLVGSPDHWHALHAIAAMESGADVYCQNPISRDVREGEAMVDAARRLKRRRPNRNQRKHTPSH